MPEDNSRLAEFLTIPEFAKAVGRHPVTVERWIAAPDGLPFCRVGRLRMTTIRWYTEWLESRREQRNPTRRRRGRPAGQQPGQAAP